MSTGRILHWLGSPARWFLHAPLRTTGVTGIVIAWIGFLSNTGGAQQFVCAASLVRPACGVTGLGGVAGREEQMFWDRTVQDQTCDGYRAYIAKYGRGEFVTTATARLTAARRLEKQRWREETKTLPLAVVPSTEGFANEEQARAAAYGAGQRDAEMMLCKPYASGEFRLAGVTVAPERWTCTTHGGVVRCSFEGQAVCRVQARTIDVAEDCSVKT